MDNTELIIEAKNFFDYYKREVGESLRKGDKVVYIDFMKLTEFSSKISEEILINPEETINLIELAIEETGLIRNVKIRLFNVPDTLSVSLNNLRLNHLNSSKKSVCFN